MGEIKISCINYYREDWETEEDFRNKMLKDIDGLKGKGWYEVSSEPIQEIKVKHLGTKINFKKEVE